MLLLLSSSHKTLKSFARRYLAQRKSVRVRASRASTAVLSASKIRVNKHDRVVSGEDGPPCYIPSAVDYLPTKIKTTTMIREEDVDESVRPTDRSTDLSDSVRPSGFSTARSVLSSISSDGRSSDVLQMGDVVRRRGAAVGSRVSGDLAPYTVKAGGGGGGGGDAMNMSHLSPTLEGLAEEDATLRSMNYQPLPVYKPYKSSNPNGSSRYSKYTKAKSKSKPKPVPPPPSGPSPRRNPTDITVTCCF
jgi:hypothetical protein